MKKLLVVVLVITLISSLMIGCAKQPQTTTAPAAEEAKKVVIKLGHIVAEDTSTHRGAVEFKKYVEEQSKGQIEVQIYANGQLGGDRQLLEAVGLGTLEMAIPATSVLTTYSPKFGILDLPFVFKDERAGFKALDGELGAKLDELLIPVGMRNLGYSYNGARSITNNVRPINEPNDLKGVKMRVMESPVFIDLFKYLGSNPTPMSFGEIFTGLQQGTVDGQENAPSLVYTSKFNEVQKYFSLTGHVQSYCANVINEKFYNGLSPEHQKIVSEGARKTLIDWQREEEIKDNVKYIDLLKQAGMQVNEVSLENHNKFVEAIKPMYEKYKAEIGQEMFDLIDKYNQ